MSASDYSPPFFLSAPKSCKVGTDNPNPHFIRFVLFWGLNIEHQGGILSQKPFSLLRGPAWLIWRIFFSLELLEFIFIWALDFGYFYL